MEPVYMDKLKFAKDLILEGKIATVDDLYNFLSKRMVADIIGVNQNSFSNFKSKRPGNFRLHELIKIANSLELPLQHIIALFYNSLNTDNHEISSLDTV